MINVKYSDMFMVITFSDFRSFTLIQEGQILGVLL